MFPCTTILLMTAIVSGQALEKKAIFKSNLYLVRANALTFSYDNDGQARCIFEIERVYVGPDFLKGEHFEARGSLPGIGFGQFGNWTSPEIKKGEVSIWWITHRPTEIKEGAAGKQPIKTPRLVAAENNPKTKDDVLFPPVRRVLNKPAESDDEWTKEEIKNNEQLFKNMEKCSLGLERVYRAGNEKRLDVLKELARTDAPLLQGWCLGRLKALLSKTEYVGYLTDLASNYPLSLWMEPAVDDELCELSNAWRKSATREEFFQRWMTGKLSDREYMVKQEECYILNKLWVGNYDDFPCPTFLRLMIDGLTTDRRSEDFKKQLLNVHGCRPKDLAGVDDGFAYLMSQIRKAEPNRRLAAARLLTHLVPLCKAQETAVNALIEDAAYKPVADQVSEALDETALVLDGLSGIDGPKWGRGEEKTFLWVRLLKVAPKPQAVRFIQEHVRPSLAVDSARVRQLVSDLDADTFRRREAASRQLAEMGLESEPVLRTALARTGSTEARRRLELLLAQFKAEKTVTSRAIPILATIATPGARSLLEKLASGSPDSPITREAKKALEARKPKHSDP